MKNFDNNRYLRAKERVQELRGFYGNATAYLIVIPLLWFVNLYYTPGFVWAIFPTLGWGIGLASHWLQVSGRHLLLGKNWERRKIQQFMKEDDFNF